MTGRSPQRSADPQAPFAEGRRRATSRSHCYGFLALVFRGPPTPEVVAQLRSPPLASALRDLGYDVAKDLTGELDDVTGRLAEEYTRLFVGPGRHVPPYASVHREGEGRLWGESTVQAKRFVEAAGLCFQGNWDSIPDHVAVELEFLQRLCAHEAELWARGERGSGLDGEEAGEPLRRCLRVEEQFLRDHLCAWAPRFCAAVSAMPTATFYRAVAELTRTIVLSDLELVTETLGVVAPTSVARSAQLD
jgi:TorA maturation chaperone TorD